MDGKIQFSEIWEMAQKYWHEIPEHFPFVKLNAFVIMPNHVHGIIVIDKPVDGRDDVGVNVDGHGHVDVNVTVETQNLASLQQKPKPINKISPQSKNLGSIIRGFKYNPQTELSTNLKPIVQ